MSFKAIFATSTLLAAQLVSGHAAITNAVGNAGGVGRALGIDSSTPRDGTRRNPFQQDATRFRGASAKTVGETVGAGSNDVESGTQAIMSEMGGQLPQVTPGGNLQMTLHQVNGDGAGPYTCMINSDGTAQNWKNIQVTENVDGNQRGRNNAGSASDHPLTAAIPAGQECTGNVAGQDNVCLVRCQNPARAGPFGGVVPVQMVQEAGANNGTAPNAAAPNAAAPNAAAPNAAAPNAAAPNAAAPNAAAPNAAAPNAAAPNAAAPNAAAPNAAAPNAAAPNTAAPNAGTNTGKTGNAAGAGNAAKKGAAKGNKNNNNNAAAADDDEEEENDKRSVDTGAFVKRIDEKTRAVEFTA
ncbi:CAS1 appressorium specific protein, partial [Metarhizium majus ARSEF 297]